MMTEAVRLVGTRYLQIGGRTMYVAASPTEQIWLLDASFWPVVALAVDPFAGMKAISFDGSIKALT